jgi:hypothetical protein
MRKKGKNEMPIEVGILLFITLSALAEEKFHFIMCPPDTLEIRSSASVDQF